MKQALTKGTVPENMEFLSLIRWKTSEKLLQTKMLKHLNSFFQSQIPTYAPRGSEEHLVPISNCSVEHTRISCFATFETTPAPATLSLLLPIQDIYSSQSLQQFRQLSISDNLTWTKLVHIKT